MPGWANARMLFDEELVQSVEEGKDPAAVRELSRGVDGADDAAIEAAFAELQALPIRADYPFEEPDDLPSIRSRRAAGSSAATPPALGSELLDKLNGAWLGRSIGCALGKPVEAFMAAHNGLASWQRQKLYLTAISPTEWPVHDYVPGTSPASAETGEVWSPLSTREHISFMESDDDIRYTVLGQILVAEKGIGFTSSDVARGWLDRLPYNAVATAETQAYRNIVCLYDQLRRQDPAFPKVDPESTVDWSRVARTLNPYREWIGAQIRVDSYGYAVPGDPELAAELAYRDARISHTKNGIYGAMYCAAMIAAAFTSQSPREIVEAGLAQIPETSRLHAAIRTTIALCEGREGDESFEAPIRELYDAFGSYHQTHTINNAAVVTAALLLSRGDFDFALRFAITAGWDTDCNGATVGSIVGAMAGATALPSTWVSPLHNTLNSAIAGYHPIAIDECARRSLAIIEQHALES